MHNNREFFCLNREKKQHNRELTGIAAKLINAKPSDQQMRLEVSLENGASMAVSGPRLGRLLSKTGAPDMGRHEENRNLDLDACIKSPVQCGGTALPAPLRTLTTASEIGPSRVNTCPWHPGFAPSAI